MSAQTNSSTSQAGDKIMSKTVNIAAPASRVWEALTDPDIMKKWMFDSEINILTDWQVGAPIVIRGNFNGKDFENNGTVLHFEPEELLQYSHLSSTSRLPDLPENHSVLDFRLTPGESQTSLTLTLSNFPTESIYKHLAFYWNVTLEVLKRLIEGDE